MRRGEGGGRGESDDSQPVKPLLCQVFSPRGGHYGAGEPLPLGESERERLGSPEGSISPAVKEQSSLEARVVSVHSTPLTLSI